MITLSREKVECLHRLLAKELMLEILKVIKLKGNSRT